MKQVTLCLLISLLLVPFSPKIIYSAPYTIFMHDGGTVEASHYEIEGDKIKVFLQSPKDAIIDFPKAYVDKIIKNKEEESNKKKNVILEQKMELCDVVGCASDYRRCCEKLNNSTKHMKSNCDKAENTKINDITSKGYYLSHCERYKKEVNFWESQCPSCYIVSSCCGWDFD